MRYELLLAYLHTILRIILLLFPDLLEYLVLCLVSNLSMPGYYSTRFKFGYTQKKSQNQLVKPSELLNFAIQILRVI